MGGQATAIHTARQWLCATSATRPTPEPVPRLAEEIHMTTRRRTTRHGGSDNSNTRVSQCKSVNHNSPPPVISVREGGQPLPIHDFQTVVLEADPPAIPEITQRCVDGFRRYTRK